MTNYRLSWRLIAATIVLAISYLLLCNYCNKVRQSERDKISNIIRAEISDLSPDPTGADEPVPLTQDQFIQLQCLLRLGTRIERSYADIR